MILEELISIKKLDLCNKIKKFKYSNIKIKIGGVPMQSNVKKGEYYLAIFKSKNHAIQLNSILQKKGYRKFQLISTPCSISHGCSYSLKYEKQADIQYIKREKENLRELISGIYQVQRINGKKQYKKIHYLI